MHQSQRSKGTSRILKTFALLGFVVSLMIALGCRKGESGASNANKETAFANSKPELKQAWSGVLEADKADDYVKAETLLYWLSRQELEPNEREAVNGQLTAVSQRLSVALEKGDAKARDALKELRSNPPNRQR